MIILRKQFSLRERNRVKEKSAASKDQLEERNTGEKPESEHNEFHQDRPNVHTSHTRTRLYRNFSLKDPHINTERVDFKGYKEGLKSELKDHLPIEIKKIVSPDKFRKTLGGVTKEEFSNKEIRKNGVEGLKTSLNDITEVAYHGTKQGIKELKQKYYDRKKK